MKTFTGPPSEAGNPKDNFQGTDMGEYLADSEPEGKEGPIAKAIEKKTSKIPSDFFLWAALGAIGVSLTLQIMGQKKTSNFVGEWAPTILILGVYNKIVKVLGSEANQR